MDRKTYTTTYDELMQIQLDDLRDRYRAVRIALRTVLTTRDPQEMRQIARVALENNQ